MKRAPEIDALKGLAIVGVVLIHIPKSGHFTDQALAFVETFQNIFSWSVLAFFFAAGFLSQTSQNNKDFSSYIKSRVSRLLIPYIFFNIFYKLALSAFYTFGLIKTADFPFPNTAHHLIAFVLSPAPPQLYFLVYLFFVQAISFAVLKNKYVYLAASFSLVAMVYIYSKNSTYALTAPHGPQIENLPVYFLNFYIGIIIARLDSCSCSRKLSLIFVMALGVGALLAGQFFIPLGGCIAVLSIFFALRCLCAELDFLLPLQKLGLQSGSIFILHAPITISVIAKINGFLLSSGPLAILTLVLFTILSCLVLNAIMSKISILKPFRI
jgi:fucose 4-O-acetylase-like acetyltransferase